MNASFVRAFGPFRLARQFGDSIVASSVPSCLCSVAAKVAEKLGDVLPPYASMGERRHGTILACCKRVIVMWYIGDMPLASVASAPI